MSIHIKHLTEPLQLGEGPHWDEKTKALYFVNIKGNTIHKYVPENDTHTSAKVGR